MRMSMGDLTYIQPLGLPAFASGLPNVPFYSGGLKGMGQVVPQGPVPPDVTAYYQAGVAAGAGGTPAIDLSQGFPSAEAQAAFNAGFNAGSGPVTLAQISGATGTGAPASAPTAQPVSISGTTIVAGVAVAALLFALVGGRR